MKIATLGFPIRGDKVLLGRKYHGAEIGKDILNGPGGKLEPEDTSLDACLIRETEEEIGITPTSFEKKAVVTFFTGGVPGFEVHIYLIYEFVGEARNTEEMTEVGWHRIGEETYQKMHDGDLHWLPKFFEEPEKFNANIYYKGNGEGFINVEFLPFSG